MPSAISAWLGFSLPELNTVISSDQVSNVNRLSNSNQFSNYLRDLNLNLSQNQRVAIFEDQNARQTVADVSLELLLEDDRVFAYPQTFTAGAARPTIAADDQNEIEGVFINDLKKENNVAGKVDLPENSIPDLSKYSIIPTDASQLSIVVQNKLTDYEFRGENLQLETRIEKSQPGITEATKVAFDVLDENNLRLNFTFNEQSQKFIGGRRLQFRIRDRERGDSDWYTIKQTFVRLPNIKSIKCTLEMKGMCQMTGSGIDYIQQVSTDGGTNWYPQEPSGALIAQPTTEGEKTATIPLLINNKSLQIKLRDFPQTPGLTITNFVYKNSVRSAATASRISRSPSP